MTSNGGQELAMKIALADLTERLKTTEQTCRYLEMCRNELAIELIRVRSEHDVLSRDYCSLLDSLRHENHPKPLTSNSSDVMIPDASSTTLKAPSSPLACEPSSPLDPKNYDVEMTEKVEEITQQLLRRIQKETGGKNSTTDVYAKILQEVTTDMTLLTEQIQSQKERLIKIQNKDKSNTMRSFFKRLQDRQQHQSSSDSTTKSDNNTRCHLEHV
jgi:hypothetical protein